MKPTRHATTGLSLKMNFTPRPDGTAVIDIIHNGEFASAIITHPITIDVARVAYRDKDIETYLAIFRMADAERMAA